VPAAREPWICPKCGRKLYIRNQEHTCNLSSFEAHFEKKDPVGRIAYDWMCSILDDLGEYDVLPMKTMIAFAHDGNKAFLVTKKSGADVSFVLTRPIASKRISGTTPYSKTKTIYRVRINEQKQLDDELASWLQEAFRNT